MRIKRLAVIIMLAIAAFIIPANASADPDMMVKDKTNKLSLADTIDEKYLFIEDSASFKYYSDC